MTNRYPWPPLALLIAASTIHHQPALDQLLPPAVALASIVPYPTPTRPVRSLAVAINLSLLTANTGRQI
ncbi:hypothetical protein Acr_00g0014500 [Actinidia rufa]|uniref:Uncharacterized protein n=1 Tax=Actinidia rufa TaxID=165716 RepID=A0A7J0DAA7_9ERIC|nr:hypothetical protein Acr_00g0014500 [Actinidia rufa]